LPELCYVDDCPNAVARWVAVSPMLERGYCEHHATEHETGTEPLASLGLHLVEAEPANDPPHPSKDRRFA
jgi:hypothetical protein